MKRLRALSLLLVVLVPACAHLGLGSGDGSRDALWRSGHLALRAGNFRGADSAFARLALHFPDTDQGREALFYLGAIRLDPRNPGWTSRGAADYLSRYLAKADSGDRAEIHRQPEARTLLELANQLNLPAGDRVRALQPQTDTVYRTGPGRIRVAPAEESQALQTENDRLRRVIADREETIKRQREELERIRNTLAPGRRP